MKWEEYLVESARTHKSFGYTDDVVHVMLGLYTELQELEDATSDDNELEELGDICWYIALYERTVGINGKYITYDIESLIGKVKRFKFYDDKAQLVYFSNLSYTLLSEVSRSPMFEKILQINIDKLRVRYPDKFNEADAIHRDLKAELEVINRS